VTVTIETIAVVTGASSGIGAATARALAARGTTVVAVARRADRLGGVIEECRQSAPGSDYVACDLRDEVAATRLCGDLWERFGAIDVLVNNAGVPMRRQVTALTMADVDEVLHLNYRIPVAMTLAILPRMTRRGRGTIVNVSSLGGRLGIAGEAAYCASKFALCGFTEAASMDLAGTGVELRLILPGPIDTEVWDQPGQDAASYEGERFAPEIVADAIVASLSTAQIEHYVPDLKFVAEMKTTDFQGFRDGMLATVRGDEEMTIPGDIR
jgi:short-subunit dehydrogenase